MCVGYAIIVMSREEEQVRLAPHEPLMVLNESYMYFLCCHELALLWGVMSYE